MEIQVLPYTRYDGVPTFRDSDIIGFYDRMVSDGTVDTVLPDGSIDTAEKFLRMITAPHIISAVAIDLDRNPLAIGWLTDLQMRFAFGHFCFFSSAWGKHSVSIGKQFVNYFLNLKSNDEYMFDVLIGFSANARAVQFSIECGAVLVGKIPDMIFSAKDGKGHTAELIYFRRAE